MTRQEARAALRRLLGSLFDAGEIRSLVADLDPSENLSDELPGPLASKNQLVNAAIDLIDPARLQRAYALLVERRPNRLEEIDQVWSQLNAYKRSGASRERRWSTAMAVCGLLVLLRGHPSRPPDVVGPVAEGHLSIGVIGPMSGPGTVHAGLALRDAVDSALALSPGLSGMKILVVDDRSDPERVEEAFRWLVDQNVLAVIGPVNSECAERLIVLCNTLKVPCLNPIAVNTDLRDHIQRDDPWWFRIAAPADQTIEALTTHLSLLGHRRVYTFYANMYTPESGVPRPTILESGLQKDFVEALKRHPAVRMVGSAAFHRGGTRTPHLRRQLDVVSSLAKSGQVDAVGLFALSDDALWLTNELRRDNPDLPVFGGPPMASVQYAGGKGAALDAIVVASYAPNRLRNDTEFKQRYHRVTNGKPVDLFVAPSYEAVKILEFAWVNTNAKGKSIHEARRLLRDKLIDGRYPFESLELLWFQNMEEPFPGELAPEASKGRLKLVSLPALLAAPEPSALPPSDHQG